MAHLCLGSKKASLDQVTAPIVVGTPHKLLDAIRSTMFTTKLLHELDFLVLDEVDRLIPVAGKYATSQDKRTLNDRINPTEELVRYILQLKRGDSVGEGKALSIPFQVIAASATVGRPLRRALNKLFDLTSTEAGLLHVIRPVVDGADANAATREVGIPSCITHVAILDSQESTELSTKLAIAKAQWLRRRAAGGRRGLLFVPLPVDVGQTLGVLHFWGVKEAKSLLTSLGIDSAMDREVDGVGVGGRPRSWQAPAPRPTTEDLVRAAVRSGLGSSWTSAVSSQESDVGEDAAAALFVCPVSGSRGLHLQDVDTVVILRPPRTMDEYLHMAGRTGRLRAGRRESLPGTGTYLLDFS